MYIYSLFPNACVGYALSFENEIIRTVHRVRITEKGLRTCFSVKTDGPYIRTMHGPAHLCMFCVNDLFYNLRVPIDNQIIKLRMSVNMTEFRTIQRIIEQTRTLWNMRNNDGQSTCQSNVQIMYMTVTE